MDSMNKNLNYYEKPELELERKIQLIDTEIEANEVLSVSDCSQDSYKTVKNGSDSSGSQCYLESEVLDDNPVEVQEIQTFSVGNEAKNECLECKAQNQMETEAKQSSKVVEKKTKRKSHLRSNWGENVGIFDENGDIKRVVLLKEVKNHSKMSLKTKSKFNFYLALVDSDCPRILYRDENCNHLKIENFQVFQLIISLTDGSQWRMRYNIFVEGVFVNQDIDSLLHIGEIHLYFGISKAFVQPYYENCTFYGNYQPIKEVINWSSIKEMSDTLKVLLTSNDLLVLKFPIADNVFKNCDSLYDQFVKCQQKMMTEAIVVFHNYWIPYGKIFQIRSNKSYDYGFRPNNNFVTNNRFYGSVGKSGKQKTQTRNNEFLVLDSNDLRNEINRRNKTNIKSGNVYRNRDFERSEKRCSEGNPKIGSNYPISRFGCEIWPSESSHEPTKDHRLWIKP